MKFSDGAVYNGSWYGDKRQDKGTYTFNEDEAEYIGEFKADQFHGRGQMSWPKEDPKAMYDGEWKFNRKEGSGSMIYQDGTQYDGEWVNDRCNGKGVKKWPRGGVYIG